MSIFRNKSLRIRVLAVILSVATFLIVIGLIGNYILRQVSEKANHIATVNVVNSVLIGNMLIKSKTIEATIFQISIPTSGGKSKDQLTSTLEESIADYVKFDKMYQSGEMSDEEKKLYSSQNELWLKVKPLADKMLELVSDDGSDRSKITELATSEFTSAIESHQAQLELLFNFQNDEGYKWAGIVAKTVKNGTIASTISVIIGFLFALILGFVFSNRLSKGLRILAEDISVDSRSVSVSANKILTSSSALLEASSQQASALELAVAAVHEISAMTERNSESSARAAKSSEQGLKSAQDGKHVASVVESAIREISSSTSAIETEIDRSHQEFGEIVKVISEIGNMTKVIHDIVFQTKLLSFNASVEAARAGEHGKGFSVVAEEVGKLAQMSGNAAREISQLLESSIIKVEDTVKATRERVAALLVEGKKKVKNGADAVAQNRDVFDAIALAVTDVNNMIQSIAVASQEQAQGIHEIDRSMIQLSQMTDTIKSASSDDSVAAENLASEAAKLNLIVGSLRNTVEGRSDSNDNEKDPLTNLHKAA